MIRLFAFCCALTTTICATNTSAFAGPVRFVFTGEVDSVATELADAFSVSDPVSGQFTFDSTLSDIFAGDSTVGRYFPVSSMQFQIGSYSGSAAANSTFVQVQNAVLDEFLVNSGNIIGASVAGASPSQFTLGMVDTTGTALSSDALPLTPPALSAFDSFTTFLGFEFGGVGRKDVRFTLTSLEAAAVPEPSSLWLLGLGAIGLVVYRKRCCAAS